jgi:hypothetical protein
LALLVAHASAQSGVSFRGRVIDASTGAPMNQAIVRVPVSGKYTLTNADGLFRIDGVPRGLQNVVVVNLGYGELSVRLNVQPDSVYTISISPQPIQLAPVVVVASRFMDQRSERRVQDMERFGRGEPVAWRKWDRDKILASGHAKPLDFLSKTARVSIRKCTGLGMPSNRLCVGVPYDGLQHPLYGGNASWTAETARRDAVQLGNTPGRGGNLSGYFASKYNRDPASAPLTINSVVVTVYLDDVPLRLEDLRKYKMEDMHRIESYGNRGERGIRFYTSGYLRLVEAGLIKPETVATREVYEFPVPWDTSSFPRRRR